MAKHVIIMVPDEQAVVATGDVILSGFVTPRSEAVKVTLLRGITLQEEKDATVTAGTGAWTVTFSNVNVETDYVASARLASNANFFHVISFTVGASLIALRAKKPVKKK